jgi:hypothetical protein
VAAFMNLRIYLEKTDQVFSLVILVKLYFQFYFKKVFSCKTSPYGHALVLNIEYKRPGSEKDVERLIKTFDSLGIDLFEKKAHINYTMAKMEAIIKKFATSPVHEKSSCSILVIMAHGDSNDQVVCYDNDVLKIDNIINWFAIKEGTDALSKIPKLLVFQNCR